MRQIPVALTPVAGLLIAAVVVAPVEYWWARRRLHRWARVRGWQFSRGGRAWAHLARTPAVPDGRLRVRSVVSGTFEGRSVVALQVTARPLPGGPGTGRGPSRYTVVAVRSSQASGQATDQASDQASGEATGRCEAAPALRRRYASTVVRDGWVITSAPTRTPVDTILDLLPAAVLAARELSLPVVVAA